MNKIINYQGMTRPQTQFNSLMKISVQLILRILQNFMKSEFV